MLSNSHITSLYNQGFMMQLTIKLGFQQVWIAKVNTYSIKMVDFRIFFTLLFFASDKVENSTEGKNESRNITLGLKNNLVRSYFKIESIQT